MKFSSKDKLMTIDELYAIGPAISIMMDGYIEKNNYKFEEEHWFQPQLLIGPLPLFHY